MLMARGLKVERPRQAVVGWQVAEAMIANLIIEAMAQVVRRERPAPGLIVRSDRGGQHVVP